MNKNSFIVALVALVLGVVIGWAAHSVLAGAVAGSNTNGAGTNVGSASEQAASSMLNAAESSELGAEDGAASRLEGAAPSSASQGSSSASAEPNAESSSADASETSLSGEANNASSASADSAASYNSETPGQTSASSVNVVEDGTYTSKDEVAAYIHQFGHLPSNYISKSKAKKAGWVSKKGNLADVLPGMSIGGSEFYNDEGSLPDAPGRTWTECDINYVSGFRGAERIVFSNDGLVFYTADHYETFEQLY